MTFNWTAGVQRAVLDIRKNPIKKRMLRDLLRGGTLPPIVVYDDHRPDNRLDVVDGLQRTHVLSEALKALLAREAGAKPASFAQDQIEQIQDTGQHVISVQEFLNQPLTLQVWEDLKAEELIRLFMLLNVGQQKVSARHLLEVLDAKLRQTFDEWGIPVQTEREEKERPQTRRVRRKGAEEEPDTGADTTRWSFALLLAGITAYVSRDPHTRIATLPQDEDAPKQDKLGERITSLGDEVCRADFQWACNHLHPLVRQRYQDTAAPWANVIRQAIFFVPMMAALGKARDQVKTGLSIERHKRELLEVLRSSDDNDPLQLVTGELSLENLWDDIRSNIGRRKRAITFVSWLQYFTHGAQGDYPIDWSIGEAFRE